MKTLASDNANENCQAILYPMGRTYIMIFLHSCRSAKTYNPSTPTIATFTIYGIQMQTQISNFLLRKLPRHCLKCCKGFYWMREFLLVLTISLATWGGFQNQSHVATCDIYKKHCRMQFSFAPSQEPTSLRPRLNQINLFQKIE